MRPLGLALLLFTHAALAQTCPLDAKVHALAEDRDSLAALSKDLQGRFKASLAATRKNCKRVETNVRVVRTLDGLSQRCATALVELKFDVDDCRDISITNGPDYTPGIFAMVAPDAKGRLEVVWVLERDRPPFAPLPAADASFYADCGSAFGSGGSPALRSIAREPSLHFDGCVLRGVPEALVRSHVSAALDESDSPTVTCRFFEGNAGAPLCAVTTSLTDAGVAVVFAGGFVPDLYPADHPHFDAAGGVLRAGRRRGAVAVQRPEARLRRAAGAAGRRPPGVHPASREAAGARPGLR